MPATTVPIISDASCNYCQRYNRPCGRHEVDVTAYTLRIRARHSRARVLHSMILPGYGHDPYTAESVRVLSERPPVHASGAFHAYPWGMPNVPRP